MGKKKEKKIKWPQIASRLEKIRQHFGYKGSQIAKLMGISPITYNRNVQGLQLPTTWSIMALHDRLGVSLEWFLFEKGPMLWKQVEEKLRVEKKPQEIKLADILPPELNEMIELMNKIPFLHHTIMLHYQELKIQHKDMIQVALERGKNEPEPASPGDKI